MDKKFLVVFISVFSIFGAVNSAEPEKQSATIDFDWTALFESTHTPQTPRDTLVRAVARFQEEGTEPGLAVDLGCGAGIDVSLLVKNGWKVVATDSESSAEGFLFNNIPLEKRDRVKFVVSTYHDFVYPEDVQFVNASFALPYSTPEHFDDVMNKMISAIPVGGRFAGQFFGLEDSWSFDKSIVFISQEKLLKYFEDFDLEYFFEDKRQGETFVGPKYWHIYHIVAKKRK